MFIHHWCVCFEYFWPGKSTQKTWSLFKKNLSFFFALLCSTHNSFSEFSSGVYLVNHHQTGHHMSYEWKSIDSWRRRKKFGLSSFIQQFQHPIVSKVSFSAVCFLSFSFVYLFNFVLWILWKFFIRQAIIPWWLSPTIFSQWFCFKKKILTTQPKTENRFELIFLRTASCALYSKFF